MLTGHKKQLEFLKNKFKLDQLSHAYLFSGASGIGKRAFAKDFVKLISCISKVGAPCEKCVNCQMIEKNTFPDLMFVGPGDEKEIQILKIREVQNFLSYKSYYGSFKTVIVEDSEKMNQEAQSCFLKTLEEPKGKTLLILLSSRPDMLLSTIASRCQTIKFFKPKGLLANPERVEKDKKILQDLLGIINLDLADKFQYAKSLDFDQCKLSDILEVIQKFFRQLLFVETGIEMKDAQHGFIEGEVVGKKYSIQKIKNILNLTEEINRKFLFTNANPKLALEILLMEI